MKNVNVVAVAAALLTTLAISGCAGQTDSTGGGPRPDPANASGGPAPAAQRASATPIKGACPLLDPAAAQAVTGPDKLSPQEQASSSPEDGITEYQCYYMDKDVALLSLTVDVNSNKSDSPTAELQALKNLGDHVRQVAGLPGPAIQYQVNGTGSWFACSVSRAADTVTIELAGPDNTSTQGYVTLVKKITDKVVQ